jgi:hypothetical protein
MVVVIAAMAIAGRFASIARGNRKAHRARRCARAQALREHLTITRKLCEQLRDERGR